MLAKTVIPQKLAFLLTLVLLCVPGCSDKYLMEHFNKNAADPRSRADEIIKSLDIGAHDTIADLGAGGGYFTLKFARITASPVYAVDINRSYLEHIEENARKERLQNIVTVLADTGDSRLPRESMNLIFIRNVFHDIDNPVRYFIKLKDTMKPGGRIAIIEYTGKGMTQKFTGHLSDPASIRNTMEKAGYHLLKEISIIEEQSFMIYRVKAP